MMNKNNNKNITNEELVERYIYAVTKRMCYKDQDDVANELRSLIDDMLAERFGDKATIENVKEVLTELGTPLELFQKYNSSNNARNCLIGGEHYQIYILVLKVVLSATFFGVLLSAVLSLLFLPKPNTLSDWVFILDWANILIQAPVSAFGFVTIIFAYLYYKEIKINYLNDLDKLPPVPTKDKSIKKWQPIGMMCFIIVFLVVFLVAPEIIGGFGENDQFITMFNVDIIRNGWIAIIMFAICGVVREIVKLLEGSYNQKVLITTLISNIASGVLASFWLLNVKIINDEFIANIGTMFADNERFMIAMFSNFQYYLLGAIIFALVLDLAVAFMKYRKFS